MFLDVPELERKLHDVLARAVDNSELAGGSLLIRINDQDLLYTDAGLADRERDVPVRRDTIFRLYSQTKPITAAAVMMLIERGVIDGGQWIQDFLPGFRDAKVLQADGTFTPAQRGVTVMDLLGMTAGLSYPDADPAGRYTADLFSRNSEEILAGRGMGTVELANAIGALPLSFQPGSSFRYSTCADVLGAIVEVADGRPFARFLQEELFEPLGMRDTAFWVPEGKRDRFAACYRRVPGGLTPFHSLHLCVGDYTREPPFASGGAGLVSTLDDYAAFAEMLLCGGEYHGIRLLSKQTVRWMTSPQHVNVWDSLDGYGYGKLMRILVDPGKACGLTRPGEYGWDGWLGTYFANFPDMHMTFLFCENTTDTGTAPVTRKLRNVFLSAL